MPRLGMLVRLCSRSSGREQAASVRTPGFHSLWLILPWILAFDRFSIATKLWASRIRTIDPSHALLAFGRFAAGGLDRELVQYTPEEAVALGSGQGFRAHQQWIESEARFAVPLLIAE
jgi:hypothetical protein